MLELAYEREAREAAAEPAPDTAFAYATGLTQSRYENDRRKAVVLLHSLLIDAKNGKGSDKAS